jgi:P-type Mg2+ transporter
MAADPFLQSRASAALIATSVLICVIGIALPFTLVGQALKFTPLPPLYWPIIASCLLSLRNPDAIEVFPD